MLELLSSNLDTIIAILAIFVSIFVYIRQKKKKCLDYGIINNTSLLEIGEEIQKDVTILYRGNPIEAVNLIEIDIKNNGNESIKEEDFVEKIKLFFGKNSEILTHNIVDKVPSNMTINVEFNKDAVDGDKIFFLPKLMNPKDKFTVKLLVSKMKEIIVESRVEGIEKMRNELDLRVDYADIIFPILMLLLGFYTYYVAEFMRAGANIYQVMLSAFLILIGLYFIKEETIIEIKKIVLKYS